MKRSLVLVLEDEALISLDTEAALVDAGFSVAVARSCAEAADFLAEYRPDAAVIDVQLSDGECIEVAKNLVNKGIPFVVHSGLLDDQCHPVFRLGPCLAKPADTTEIVDVVKSLPPRR